MKPEIEKALGIIQVWNFIPDGWKVPLGFDVLVGQAKESIALLREELERLEQDFEYKNEQLGAALLRAEKAEAELARFQPLIEAAEELLEVAALRGDADLPHPADDPKLWTARMQTAWDELRAAALECRAEEEKNG